jgi:hypothetical protein
VSQYNDEQKNLDFGDVFILIILIFGTIQIFFHNYFKLIVKQLFNISLEFVMGDYELFVDPARIKRKV